MRLTVITFGSGAEDSTSIVGLVYAAVFGITLRFVVSLRFSGVWGVSIPSWSGVGGVIGRVTSPVATSAASTLWLGG